MGSIKQSPALNTYRAKILYGGEWREDEGGSGGQQGYVNGETIYIDGIDGKTMNLVSLHRIASKYGYKPDGQTNYHYRVPRVVTRRDCVKINHQKDVEKMLKQQHLGGEVELYIDGAREKPVLKDFPVILFWNCRGLGDSAVEMLKVLIAIYEPSAIFLIETRLSSDAIEDLAGKLGFEQVWDYSSTRKLKAVGKDNCVRLAMLVKNNMKVDLLQKTENYLDFVVTQSTGKQWRMTGFYGHPKNKNRSWEWLDNLYNIKDRKIKRLPWIIFGDFNEILLTTEKRGGRKKTKSEIRDFFEIVQKCDLHNLPFVGSRFTWEWHGIKQRLDRALVSLNFMQKPFFPDTKLFHLTDGRVSDHVPIVIQTDGGKHKIENASSLRWSMGKVFEFAKKLEGQFRAMELKTVSEIVNTIRPKYPGAYCDILKMIAPKVIQLTDIAVLDKKNRTIKCDRLFTPQTCYTLGSTLWNSMIISDTSLDEDNEQPAEIPEWPPCEINREVPAVNLSKYFEDTWNLVYSYPSGSGKITKQDFINLIIDKQVEELIEWLHQLFLQNDDKPFEILRHEGRRQKEELGERALLVGRAVILHNIIISLIERGNKFWKFIEEREKSLVKISGVMLEILMRTVRRKPTLKSLCNICVNKSDGVDKSKYKIETRVRREQLRGLERERFRAEKKAMMCDYLKPLIKEIILRGPVETDKLAKFVKDTGIVDRPTIEDQIDLLLNLKVLRLGGNDEIELVEAKQTPRLTIVERLHKAADTALEKLRDTTSKTPYKYTKHINQIKKEYKK